MPATITTDQRARQSRDRLPHSPAFLFYPRDWCGSRRVQAMSFAERGMYLELLCEQWESGAVPATPKECAALIGGTMAVWMRAWPKIQSCFNVRRRDGKLVNPKLDGLRREREKFLKAKRDGGIEGARRRWKPDGTPIGEPSTPNGLPMAKNAYSSDLISSGSGSGSQSDLISKKKKKVHTHTRAARASADRHGFDAFWDAYPKKQSKGEAWRVWQKLAPDEGLLAEMIVALDWQRQEPDWLKNRGQYVPEPAKWLRNEKWKDQPPTTPHVNERTLAIAQSGKEFVQS